MEGAGEPVLQNYPCHCVVLIAGPGWKSGQQGELAEQLGEEQEKDYGLKEREEEQYWVAEQLLHRSNKEMRSVGKQGHLSGVTFSC